MPNYFAINLVRSRERWSVLVEKAKECSIELTRVEAIDGALIDQKDWVEFDVEKFKHCNGRPPKPGEYGCYRSHVNAIEAFLKSGHLTGVILEDDAEITTDLAPFCSLLDEHFSSNSMIVRLTSHRIPWFEKQSEKILGHVIGRCWFGPTGSSAAYWITRSGAERLLNEFRTGYLPVDIMIERSWYHGVDVVQTKPVVLKKPNPPMSTIEECGGNPQFAKFRWYNRLPAYCYRTIELLRRFAYTAGSRKIAAK